jgi:lipopolysaccharide/colanic/teichoic acid biosynthesis glycosyltransferase
MRSTYPASKRVFDVIASGLGLVGLAPVLGACALAVKMSSPGPVLFGHERVGLGGRRFKVLKFRSMTHRSSGAQITSANDARITPIGRVLRRYKLDELPQLINVLRGDMSLVGPRPEVARYVERYPDAYARILQVRPGITDLAAIEYRDEEQLLAAATDPEQVYVSEILPAKIRLYDAYLEQRSLLMDAKILMRTLAAVIR